MANTTPVVLYPAINSTIFNGSQPYLVFGAPLFFGGFISNPPGSGDQGIGAAESLYITLDGTAPNTSAGGSTFEIYPGSSFKILAGSTKPIWATAKTSGHKFSAVAYQEPQNFTPATGNFPPVGPTTLQNQIPSYLYVEYNDDDTLQAFITAYNNLFQGYLDWFNQNPLTIYTNPNTQGTLLDWVAAGFYGFPRPALPSGTNSNIGPYNTYDFNYNLAYNQMKIVGSQNVYATTDDIFKRILTWHLYKGDGKVFTVRWLKRRVYRFLFGVDGTDVDCSNTTPISVTFGGAYSVNIFVGVGQRIVTGGALYDRFEYDTQQFNALQTRFNPYTGPQIPLAPIFKSAVDAGVLELPFQDTFNVVISST